MQMLREVSSTSKILKGGKNDDEENVKAVGLSDAEHRHGF